MENEDFGFHDYDSAMENGDILVLSGFQILPNAGGWNNQYRTDVEDLLMYLRGLAWARSLKGNENAGSEDNEVEGAIGEGIAKVSGIEAFK